MVCGFNFHETYGEIGRTYVHVHHLFEISQIKKEYVVNPINDLRPVCPNCHTMLHKKKPAYTIEEFKDMIIDTKNK
ncbi:HNH endonuclease [Cohnella luojiensis]|uniref:HNH endonuclease n=1 Tax=Cohnella luojiensis TaxID=652876 RepID=UPI001F0DC7DE|nr:HNH endonuclease [Cohnella luojiensis]